MVPEFKSKDVAASNPDWGSSTSQYSSIAAPTHMCDRISTRKVYQQDAMPATYQHFAMLLAF